MSGQNLMVNAVQPDEKWIYQLGGITALAVGVAYLAIIALYVSVGVPPEGGEAWLDYLIGKTGIWWAIVAISVLTNFLYVPVALSFYFALRGVNRMAMLIGIAFVGLFVVFENAVNWTVYGALIVLSDNYAAATTESQRALFVAAATFASAVLESPLAAAWAIGTLSFGFLIIGFVMRNGVAVILNAVFAMLWLFLVGQRLYRLGQ